MEKYEVINKDFCKKSRMVIEKKGDWDDLITTAAENTREMYKHFYPDTSMVKIDADHKLDDVEIDTIIKSFDETLGKNKRRLRVMLIFSQTILIFASAEFKKVAEKMECGDEVEYRNPYRPEAKGPICEVMSGIYYEGGYAYIDVSPVDLNVGWDEENNERRIDREFAIYWRPVEEEK